MRLICPVCSKSVNGDKVLDQHKNGRDQLCYGSFMPSYEAKPYSIYRRSSSSSSSGWPRCMQCGHAKSSNVGRYCQSCWAEINQNTAVGYPATTCVTPTQTVAVVEENTAWLHLWSSYDCSQ